MKKKHAPYIKLKRLFASRGITYKDVAKVIHTTEATVMCKINGDSDFTISEMKSICATFGIDPSVFFADNVA
jgi:transcriptional regulator with XRE-family HTH domain